MRVVIALQSASCFSLGQVSVMRDECARNGFRGTGSIGDLLE
jgi:hypothetical protein